jgi:hypothetical protein
MASVVRDAVITSGLLFPLSQRGMRLLNDANAPTASVKVVNKE